MGHCLHHHHAAVFIAQARGEEMREEYGICLEPLGEVSGGGALRLEGVEKAYRTRAGRLRALVVDPELLLLDESFGSLDLRTGQELQERLRDIWRERGSTLIFVTHRIEEAVYLASDLVVLGHRPGRVVRSQEVDLPPERDRLSQDFTELLVSLRRTFDELVMEEGPED